MRWVTQAQKARNNAPRTIGPVRRRLRGLLASGSCSSGGVAPVWSFMVVSKPVLLGGFEDDGAGEAPDLYAQRLSRAVLIDVHGPAVEHAGLLPPVKPGCFDTALASAAGSSDGTGSRWLASDQHLCRADAGQGGPLALPMKQHARHRGTLGALTCGQQDEV